MICCCSLNPTPPVSQEGSAHGCWRRNCYHSYLGGRSALEVPTNSYRVHFDGAITFDSSHCTQEFCRNRPVVWENLSDMKTYPRLTIRLSSDELNRVHVLARVRNRSRGQVIRDALNLYFRAVTAEKAR